MPNIIEELQSDAVDQAVSVSTLLRKVKYVAAKLQLEDTIDWADHELRGYKENVPDYRVIHGQPKAYSPYHGAQPIGGEAEFLQKLSRRPVGQEISAIEDLLNGDKAQGLMMPFSEALSERLLRNNYGWTEAYLDVSRSALVAIVDHVRTTVLDWALELERKGITGEGRSFSPREKEIANREGVSIQNFYGPTSMGNAEGPNSRINVGSVDQSKNKVEADQIFQQVEGAVADSGLDAADKAEILAAVAAMRDGRKSGGFHEAYANFAALAANHATLLAPFLPALGSLL